MLLKKQKDQQIRNNISIYYLVTLWNNNLLDLGGEDRNTVLLRFLKIVCSKVE